MKIRGGEGRGGTMRVRTRCMLHVRILCRVMSCHVNKWTVSNLASQPTFQLGTKIPIGYSLQKGPELLAIVMDLAEILVIHRGYRNLWWYQIMTKNMHILVWKGQTHLDFIATLVYWSLARQTTLTKFSISLLKLELSYHMESPLGTGLLLRNTARVY